MKKLIIRFLFKVRWVYFHIHPGYIKFYMDSERTEAHFQHIRSNTIHSNYAWIDTPVKETQ